MERRLNLIFPFGGTSPQKFIARGSKGVGDGVVSEEVGKVLVSHCTLSCASQGFGRYVR